MRKAVLIPLVLGLIFLAIGVTRSYSCMKGTGPVIHNFGRVRPFNETGDPEETQPQQTNSTTQLDIIGFLIILASLAFFTVAYFNNRNFLNKQKSTETF